jgi:hypothetical protein
MPQKMPLLLNQLYKFRDVVIHKIDLQLTGNRRPDKGIGRMRNTVWQKG